jgi:hypothetical protein
MSRRLDVTESLLFIGAFAISAGVGMLAGHAWGLIVIGAGFLLMAAMRLYFTWVDRVYGNDTTEKDKP